MSQNCFGILLTSSWEMNYVYFSCMLIHNIIHVTPCRHRHTVVLYIQEYCTSCILSLSHTHTHTHTHYLGSLDPDGDPLCALLMIDYHALRAGEYDFLINLFSQWEVSSQHYMLLIDLAYPKLLTNSHINNWLYRILCSHFLACFC